MFFKSKVQIWTPEIEFTLSNAVMKDGLEYFFNRIFNDSSFQDLYMGLINADGYISRYLWQSLGYYNLWQYTLDSPTSIESKNISFVFNQWLNVQGLFLSPDKNKIYTTIIFPNYVRTDRIKARYQVYV